MSPHRFPPVQTACAQVTTILRKGVSSRRIHKRSLFFSTAVFLLGGVSQPRAGGAALLPFLAGASVNHWPLPFRPRRVVARPRPLPFRPRRVASPPPHEPSRPPHEPSRLRRVAAPLRPALPL